MVSRSMTNDMSVTTICNPHTYTQTEARPIHKEKGEGTGPDSQPEGISKCRSISSHQRN